jgi:lipoprotein NlpD
MRFLILPEELRPTRIVPLLAASLLAAALLATLWGCAGNRYDHPSAIHTVGEGEKIEQIALRYRIDPLDLRRLNDVPPGFQPASGSELFVPSHDAYLPGDEPNPVLARATPQAAGQAGSGQAGAERTIFLTRQPKNSKSLIWPVSGKIARAFGGKKLGAHKGIDISATAGATVRAAAGGRVAYSGNGIPGYGNLVILEHKGGYTTHYANNLRNLVREGGRVKKGYPIAQVGQTGSATYPHLHFEIRCDAEALNPARFLPLERVVRRPAAPVAKGETRREPTQVSSVNTGPQSPPAE